MGWALRRLMSCSTTPDGKVLTKTLTLPVQANDPPVVQVTRLDLAKGQAFTLDDTLLPE